MNDYFPETTKTVGRRHPYHTGPSLSIYRLTLFPHGDFAALPVIWFQQG
jgi:hypothetical protein